MTSDLAQWIGYAYAAITVASAFTHAVVAAEVVPASWSAIADFMDKIAMDVGALRRAISGRR